MIPAQLTLETDAAGKVASIYWHLGPGAEKGTSAVPDPTKAPPEPATPATVELRVLAADYTALEAIKVSRACTAGEVHTVLAALARAQCPL